MGRHKGFIGIKTKLKPDHPWVNTRKKEYSGGEKHTLLPIKRKCKCSLNGKASCPKLYLPGTYQPHHPNRVLFPDWTLCIRRNHHLFIKRQVQQLSVNNDSLMDLINLRDAIQYEIDRRGGILKELQGGNLRQSNEQPQPG